MIYHCIYYIILTRSRCDHLLEGFRVLQTEGVCRGFSVLVWQHRLGLGTESQESGRPVTTGLGQGGVGIPGHSDLRLRGRSRVTTDTGRVTTGSECRSPLQWDVVSPTVSPPGSPSPTDTPVPRKWTVLRSDKEKVPTLPDLQWLLCLY